MNDTEYFKIIKRLRKERKLHTVVEERLIKILQIFAPEFHSFKEIQGVAGGRNDLIAFEYSGRKVLFEIFASQSQVAHDLRLMDKTEADVKIGLIIDKEVDEKVFTKYIRENPKDTYPYFFLKDLFFKEGSKKFEFKLRKLIRSEDEAIFKAILKHEYSYERFKELCEREGLELVDPDNLKNEKITFEILFNQFILSRLIKFNKNYSLEKIVRWLAKKKVYLWALTQLQLGFNVFLYTDLNETFDLLSDIDLVDFLRIGPEVDSPYIILSINNIVNSILEAKIEPKKFEVKVIINHSFFNKLEEENEVIVSLPNNTKDIVIYKPWEMQDKAKELSDAEILEMINIV